MGEAIRKAPVSVCMIVRNEAPHVEDTFKSIRPFVQELCVVDTGSSDATPEIAQRYADRFEVFTECNDPESGLIVDFSMARQRSMALATKPWRMWIDGDDRLVNGERLAQVVDECSGDGSRMIVLPYEYDHDHHGNVTCRFFRERLVFGARESFEWQAPVHETLVPQDPNTHKIPREDVWVRHLRRVVNKKVEPGRNLRILEKYNAKTGGKDARTLHYLGLEYGWCGQLDKAIEFHKAYLELSGWDEEKCLACLEIAKHYLQKNEPEQAIDWALRSLREREDWGEPYFALSRAYYMIAMRDGNPRCWQKCVAFGRRYLEMPPTQTMLFMNPLDRAVEVHRYLNMGLNRLGDVKGALQSVEQALSSAPDDPNLLLNRSVYQDYLGRGIIKQILEDLVRAGERLPENKITAEAAGFINAILDGKFQVAARAATVSEAKRFAENEVAPRPANSDGLDIVLFTGPAYERWTPETIAATGIGGSETMAWEMARRLVKLGHRVRHYGDCEGVEGVYDGVEWIHYTKCHDIACDVFITSRRPEVLDDQLNIKRRLTLAWVHDVNMGPGLTYERALKVDRFLCLTNWHRDYFLAAYQHVHPSQVIVTRNGIDLSMYESGEVERHPHRIFYSSSPDRGLQPAILAMPKIREAFPDAELHVAYGFSNWKRTTDMRQQATIRRLEAMLEEYKEHGVVYHDRLSPVDLAKLQRSCGVWAYLTWWVETSCITAMQAQAAGCRIVTTPLAALNETVSDRGTMIEGDWLAPESQAKLEQSVIAHMQREDESDREALKRYAREHFSLDTLAEDWHRMLYGLLADVSRDVVVPYKAA